MTDTKQEQAAPETTSIDERKQPSGALEYARRHPAMTAIGAAAIGLLGGVELAAGVLIGAGVMAVARARDQKSIEEEAHDLKERGRKIMPDMKQRARAVVKAARGELQPS